MTQYILWRADIIYIRFIHNFLKQFRTTFFEMQQKLSEIVRGELKKKQLHLY